MDLQNRNFFLAHERFWQSRPLAPSIHYINKAKGLWNKKARDISYDTARVLLSPSFLSFPYVEEDPWNLAEERTPTPSQSRFQANVNI